MITENKLMSIALKTRGMHRWRMNTHEVSNLDTRSVDVQLSYHPAVARHLSPRQNGHPMPRPTRLLGLASHHSATNTWCPSERQRLLASRCRFWSGATELPPWARERPSCWSPTRRIHLPLVVWVHVTLPLTFLVRSKGSIRRHQPGRHSWLGADALPL